MAGKIKITLVRGLAGKPEVVRRNLQTLGLSRRQSSVVRDDDPATRGILRRVEHMVKVEELEG
ncbi:MAG: 50S ribosomal protein L30 [Clostridia bacterium]|nr:MAG: 50S ribosomal protein L30 [Clostridia bacterium]